MSKHRRPNKATRTPEENHLRHLLNVQREKERLIAREAEKQRAQERAAIEAARQAEERRHHAAELAALRRAGMISPSMAAKQLGISPSEIRALVSAGAITPGDNEYLSAAAVTAVGADPAAMRTAIDSVAPFKTPAAAEYLGVEPETIRQAVHKGLIAPAEERAWRFGVYFIFWRRDLDAHRAEIAAMGAARTARREKRAARKAEAERAAEAAIAEHLRVAMPARRATTRIIAHLGPTNSGKTHAALERLIEAGAGTYASPLRMMAQEAHARLAARLGESQVGLVTGEERVNAAAPIIACTTEMAPRATPLLILDEAHWLADRERGSAWTSALLSTECAELHLVGSADVMPLLARTGFPMEIRHYERFVPLVWAGPIKLGDLEPQSVVVAFSRSAVYALARDITRAPGGRRVGVLYGAMPLAERRRQIAAFMAGEIEVMVATDVLGHGVNLPARTVVFAESTKYDGRVRRNLEPWEVAQIAGRAGRYGFHDQGRVGVLAGSDWAVPNEAMIKAGLTPTVQLPDGHFAFRRLEFARFGPTRASFVELDPRLWLRAFGVWEKQAQSLAQEHPWINVADISGQRGRLTVLGATVLGRLLPADAWSLIHAPLDVIDTPEYVTAVERGLPPSQRGYNEPRDPFAPFDLPGPGEILKRFGASLCSPAERLGDLVNLRIRGQSLEGLEKTCTILTSLRWFALHWPGRGSITLRAIVEREAMILERIAGLVSEEVTENAFGICDECGAPTMPWFSVCDVCHAIRRGGRWGQDEYEDDDEDDPFVTLKRYR